MNLSRVGFAGLLVLVTVLSMAIPAYADHVTITPSSADTSIFAGAPDQNYGGQAQLQIRSGLTTQIQRILVKFDLSSIPSGSTINIAYLQLYYYGYNVALGDPVGTTYTAYRVTTNWLEGNGNGGLCPGVVGATWNNPACSLPAWTTAGGDFTTSGSFANTVPAAFGYMTWTVTDIVKAWIEGGQPNNGFLVRDPNDGATFNGFITLFFSKEAGPPATQFPILKIDYTTTPPIIPEYPYGLAVLAAFMVIGYGVIRRRTVSKQK